MSKSAKRAAIIAALATAAAVALPVGAATAATTGHPGPALATSATSAPDGDYCGPTTQLVPGGAVYAKVCVNIYDRTTYAYAYITVNNTGYNFGTGIVYLNSGGTYYNYADCDPPSYTVLKNFYCSTAISQGSLNGYVQGQIELGINDGEYKAFSPSPAFP